MRELIHKRITQLEGERFKLYKRRDSVTRINSYQVLSAKIETINNQIENQRRILEAINKNSTPLKMAR